MIIESLKQSKVGHVQTPTQHHLLQEVPGLQGTQSEPQAEYGGQNDPGLPADHRNRLVTEGMNRKCIVALFENLGDCTGM